ncbi:MAG: CDP-glycerol glycerophosphotransferase family protein [Lachnospiraceae bacterium]|nr:CDP-glycerol glycerophosphotransferase family protein [Lachnospiraceae bacterium]
MGLGEIKKSVIKLVKSNKYTRDFAKYLIKKRNEYRYATACKKNDIDENLIIFESFMGRSYADSPRAIYEEMIQDEAFKDMTFVWAFKSPASKADIPELSRAKLVKYRSKEFFTLYSKAKYFVSNSRIDNIIKRREGQEYIQCWHGTPLKRLGYDIETGDNALHSQEELCAMYKLDAERYTYMLSPSKFTSEKLTSAFNLPDNNPDTIIVEEGYPRNDFLSNFTQEDVKRIKTALGIEDETRKLILYAPTWRDNQYDHKLGYTYKAEVDFDHLRKELEDEFVILFRAHYFVANSFDFEKYEGFIYDVSKYENINDLYAVADHLITDYSSVFFDYSILKRPITFFMYDLEAYANDIRGFYISLEDLPGEIVQTEDELIRELKKEFVYDERYKKFNDRFTYLDDGKAAKRAVDRIFRGIGTEGLKPVGGKKKENQSEEQSQKQSDVQEEKKASLKDKGVVFFYNISKKSAKIRQMMRTALNVYNSIKFRIHTRGLKVVDKSVVFIAFNGKSYSDTPKAIYEYMLTQEEYKDYKFIWVFKDVKPYMFLKKNPNTYLVKDRSKNYEKALAKAKYWVCNYRIYDYITPKKNQVYVQCWHGTPLKRLGYDIGQSDNVMNSQAETEYKYRSDAKRFQYLLSPSAFATEKFSTAWNLVNTKQEDKIIEVGYPRNDYLYNYKEEDAAAIKEELGIPEGKKVILYAPTWRDNQHTSGVGYVYETKVDFHKLKEELGEEYVILFRAHYLIANAFDFDEFAGFVYNVSSYDDISRLYVISDLLITDYSSVFFDYANLLRPIIFYMYDKEYYAEGLRGFYLDLEELPGPIVEQEEDLIEKLHSVDEWFSYDEKYQRFHDKYNCLDDGHASERFVETVFGR